MCLLLYKPAGIEITLDSLPVETIHRQNPNGFGIAFRDSIAAETKVCKGLYAPDRQRKIIEKIGKREAIVHWRFATHGVVDVPNCHPFRLTDGTILAHNGVVDVDCLPGLSDTATLVHAHPTWETILDRVRKESSRNRFILWGRGRAAEIVGSGSWIEGVWYSNLWWKNPTPLDWDWETTDAANTDLARETLLNLVETVGLECVTETLSEIRWDSYASPAHRKRN